VPKYLAPFILLSTIMIAPVMAAEEPQKLDQVVVTATRTEALLKDSPASMTVITREELQQRPIENILEAVRESTGITLSGRGVGSRGVISLRGMQSHQTLILIDGKRTTATDNILGHSNFQYNQVPIEAIERIEIVRGPLSALYGSEALGGVINIITRAVPEKWSGSIRAQGGIRDDSQGGDEASVGVYASGPLGDKVGLTVSASYLDKEKTELNDNALISEIEGQDVTQYLARLTLTPWEGHRFEAEIAKVDEDRARDTNSRGKPPFYESSYDLDRSHYALGYDGTFGSTLLHLNYYQSDFDQVNHRTNGVSPTVTQKLEDRIVDGHVSFPLLGKQLITLGGEYRTEGLKHPSIAGGKKEITYKALFIQDEIDLADNLLLTLGLRGDNHEEFGSETSPRAYLVYHLNDNLSLKGGYGHGFKAPTIKQVSPEYRFNGHHNFVGNPDVGPETSDNYEIAALWHNQRHQVGVTYFYNDIEDLIKTSCITNCKARFGRTFHFENVNEVRIQGLETEIGLALTNNLDFNFNHTYLDAKDQTADRRLADRPRHSANVRLNMQLPQWGVNTALRAEYIGSQVQYSRKGETIDIPNYTLWHFSVSKVLSQNFTLRAGVDNIGDVDLSDKSDNFFYAERGRFYYMGLNAQF